MFARVKDANGGTSVKSCERFVVCFKDPRHCGFAYIAIINLCWCIYYRRNWMIRRFVKSGPCSIGKLFNFNLPLRACERATKCPLIIVAKCLLLLQYTWYGERGIWDYEEAKEDISRLVWPFRQEDISRWFFV